MKHTEYLKKKNKRERRKKILSIFAAFVVFITTYALVLPAITLDVSTAKKESGIAYEQMQFKATAAAASVTAADSTEEEAQVEEPAAEEPKEEPAEEIKEEEPAETPEEEASAVSDEEEEEPEEEAPAEPEKEEAPAKEAPEVREDKNEADSAEEKSSESAPAEAEAADTEKTAEDTVVDQAGTDTAEAAAAATAETAAEFQIPELDALDFDDILTGRTNFYYYHVESTEEAEELSSDSIDDWKKVNSDTVLAPEDFVRVYLSYEIPAGALNETNAVARYKLPAGLELSDKQIKAINKYENGIAASMSGSDHDKYLGAEAIEGSRTPDEKADDEYISAAVKVEKTHNDRQELVFTFIPYTVGKNQISYDEKGEVKTKGKEVKGFFTFDLKTSQIDFEKTNIETVEKEDGTTEEIQYSEAKVDFTKDIDRKLILAAPVEKEEPQEQKSLTNEGADYTVTVSYTDDAQIPDNAELAVREIEKDTEEYASYLEQAKGAVDETKSVSDARFFDITILVDGEKVEPRAPVSVQINFAGIEQTNTDDTQLLHYKDNDEIEVMDKAEFSKSEEKTVDTVEFEADGFSIYAIVGTEVLSTRVITANGDTYEIDVTFGPKADIPAGAELQATEILPGTEEYEEYFKQTSAAVSEDQGVAFARFFDIKILHEGKEIEPAVPVQVEIKYLGGTDITGSASIEIIHFADSGVELIDPTEKNVEGSMMQSVEYTQGSFSVIGTIGTTGFTTINSVADNLFLIYAQEKGDFYALTHGHEGGDLSATLAQISTDEDAEGILQWRAKPYGDGYALFCVNFDNSALNYYLGVNEDDSFVFTEEPVTVWSSVNGTLKYVNGARTGYLAFENGVYAPTESVSGAAQILFAEIKDSVHEGVRALAAPILRAGDVPEDAPAHSKRLIDNEDGTYTIALDVTGTTSSSSTTEVTKSNVVLILDVSSSMVQNYTTYKGSRMTRLAAEKRVLTDQDGLIDQLLAVNTTQYPDMIEVAVATFGTRASTLQSATYNKNTLKNAINNIPNPPAYGNFQYTNWEEALQEGKRLADGFKNSQPDEKVYVIFLTDGEPTVHANSYNYSNNYTTQWNYARDDARNLVTAGYEFYGLFTWGNADSSHYLSSLIQYANTGTGNSSSSLSPQYQQYFANAESTEDLIAALDAIIHSISESVGYTNVELEDGITTMTSSGIKVNPGGSVTGLKYYRKGGNYSTTANDGLGEEWTDAPPATINADGEVDWNLGNIVLEDHVTYTVTFVVWPSQESLDLVADLNNELIDYDSLSDDQQAQIFISGGQYVLKTNTDYPTVTYSTITTVTEDGQTTTVVSDPTTVNIPNPDPVGLSESKLNVEKKWDDATDVNQRPDSVTLDLMKSDVAYLEGIVLNNDNNWKLPNYASIAPGIMVSQGRPAYSEDDPQVTFGGTTYGIIESGHDYHFVENPMDYHFELTAYEYHPMLMDGVLYNVTFIYDGSGNITGIEKRESITDLISATNTLKGRLYIQKEVDIPDGAIGYDLKTTTFPMTVNLLDAEGEPLISTGTEADANGLIYRIVYGENHPDTDEGWTPYDPEYGNYGRSPQRDITDGTITESIYQGDQIYVANIPSGATYEVSEDTLSGGWKLVGIEYSDEEKTIGGNDEDQVTVTNTLPSFEVGILKTTQDGSTPLENAVFSLYGSDYMVDGAVNPDAEALKTGLTSGPDGKFDLGILSSGTYYLAETAAPTGYNLLTSAVVITVDGNSTATKDGQPLYVTYVQDGNSASTSNSGVTITRDGDVYIYTLQVSNDEGILLPLTGGPGTFLYTLSGIAVIFASALMYGFRMRRRERRLN